MSLNTDFAVNQLEAAHRTNIAQALAQILDSITNVLSTKVSVALKRLTSKPKIDPLRLIVIVSQTSHFVDTNSDSLI